MTVADRLRDIAEMARDSAAETELLKLADELDGGDIHLEPNPWGLVIDQVVGLAAVYDIEHGGPTTPKQVHDLWQKVVIKIANNARQAEREVMTECLRDAERTADYFRAASDQWHQLTEALRGDLREDDANDDDDADVWRVHVRKALWMAYGIGRRHQRDGLTFTGHPTVGLILTPFECTERS